MAEFDFLENPRLMRIPTKKWIENPCERILVPDKDFVYMLEIQDVPVRARDKFIHWRMMTSEEEQTFKECEHERSWRRSVPFMIGVSAITAILSRRARHNLWQKAICQYAALTVGRDLGHFSYWYLEHERWAERFMHLQGSTYGEALRRRDCQLHRWYPNGAPPIPKNLLYSRKEPPSSLPAPPPPPPTPPTSTATSHPSEETPQFTYNAEEKYLDFSFEYSSPLFTSSFTETPDSDEKETIVQQEESSISSYDHDDDESVPSSLSPPFPSSPPSAFPQSSPPAFPASSPPAFPSSSVDWNDDDATNLSSNDSGVSIEDTENVIEEKEKKRNVYGDILEEDIQEER